MNTQDPSKILIVDDLPENLQALYWKSYVLFQTGSYQQSSVYALRYLGRNPASGDAHKILGLDYFMQGQSALAETALQRACDLSPADSEANRSSVDLPTPASPRSTRTPLRPRSAPWSISSMTAQSSLRPYSIVPR